MSVDQRKKISISIVSHAQGSLIRNLLSDLQALGKSLYDLEILLTINIPEDEAFVAEFPSLSLRIIRNIHPKGFGANHNAAFKYSIGDYFVILNPDVRFSCLDFSILENALSIDSVGVCAPAVFSTKGCKEDSARHFPTISRLIKRKFDRSSLIEYEYNKSPLVVEWVAGIFMMFKRHFYEQVGGFDERYFMYLEDADICRRLMCMGYHTILVPAVSIVHDAQRHSRREFKYFMMHIRSAIRFILNF